MLLIIGYGNELMGNDGFGVYTLHLIQKEIQSDKVKFVETHQLTPELALEIIKAKKVIFIDASFGDESHILATPILRASNLSTLHNLTPNSLLYICENLYNVKVEFEIFSALFDSFEIDSELDSKAKELALEIAEFILNDIKEI